MLLVTLEKKKKNLNDKQNVYWVEELTHQL